jgi:hypothetical protein
MEGLSIDAASANVGRRCMELLDIWEEEEETMPTHRLTWEFHFYRILWCGMLNYLSIPLARPFSTSLCPPDFCPPDNAVCIEDDSCCHWCQEPDLE